MKKKPTDINPERSEKYRHLEKLGYLPKFIIISACCGFVAFIAMVLSVLAMYNSTNANAKVDYEIQAAHEEVTLMKNLMALHNVYLQEVYVLMKAEGLDPPPLPEE